MRESTYTENYWLSGLTSARFAATLRIAVFGQCKRHLPIGSLSHAGFARSLDSLANTVQHKLRSRHLWPAET